MDDNEEPIRVFIEESRENLERMDREIVALESRPGDPALISSLFRTLHTLKASCGFFDFTQLQVVAHAAENLLGALRDRTHPYRPEVGTLLLAVADRIRRTIDSIERSGQETPEDDAALTAALEAILHAPPPQDPRPAGEQASTVATEAPDPARPTPAGLDAATAAMPPPTVPTAPPAFSPASESAPESAPVETSVRVGIEILDQLVDLVGELVLVRNQILQRVDTAGDEPLTRAVKQLSKVTGKLQEGIMRTRMQPIRTVWNRFPRLVRDTALTCGKEVTLELHGAETEMDRSVLEVIRDPLTHLVRNAIDHGFERPEERAAAGKPRAGTLALHAEYVNGQVVLTIGDDGKGIAPERIRRRAAERRLLEAERLAALGDAEVIQLIFLPGFSTSETISQVSGRGVGMDVVKTNIESIGGTVDIQSVPGKGTRVQLKIPSTLAIVQGLIVRAGSERFVVPETALVELLQLEPADVRRSIHFADATPILQLRHSLLPLVELSGILRMSATPPWCERDRLSVMILQVESQRFGVVVEEIYDTEEIVIKPVSKLLAALKTFAGATILGDGTMALVLDVAGLATQARVKPPRAEAAAQRPASAAQPLRTQSMYVVVESALRRFAIPMGEIHRLEQVEPGQIRPGLEGELAALGGRTLPVYRLDRLLDPQGTTSPGDAAGSLVVVPYEGDEVGLYVDRVVDVVPMEERSAATGTWVMDGHLTERLSARVWRESIPRAGRPAPCRS